MMLFYPRRKNLRTRPAGVHDILKNPRRHETPTIIAATMPLLR
jgi:hypothetical protein